MSYQNSYARDQYNYEQVVPSNAELAYNNYPNLASDSYAYLNDAFNESPSMASFKNKMMQNHPLQLKEAYHTLTTNPPSDDRINNSVDEVVNNLYNKSQLPMVPQHHHRRNPNLPGRYYTNAIPAPVNPIPPYYQQTNLVFQWLIFAIIIAFIVYGVWRYYNEKKVCRFNN